VELTVGAPRAATVRAVEVAEGDHVEQGQAFIELEAAEA
jgi:biotin carboxyl carrier protein